MTLVIYIGLDGTRTNIHILIASGLSLLAEVFIDVVTQMESHSFVHAQSIQRAILPKQSTPDIWRYLSPMFFRRPNRSRSRSETPSSLWLSREGGRARLHVFACSSLFGWFYLVR